MNKIHAKGSDKFNPTLHEAVSGEGNHIAEIVLDDYWLNEKVVHAVKVRVK